MSAQSSAQRKRLPQRARFYVVKQICASTATMVTVLHHVPAGAQELGSFDHPNPAIEFAEIHVQELQTLGVAAELVDPPYGLVGAG
jgi:hypothetical protein